MIHSRNLTWHESCVKAAINWLCRCQTSSFDYKIDCLLLGKDSVLSLVKLKFPLILTTQGMLRFLLSVLVLLKLSSYILRFTAWEIHQIPNMEVQVILWSVLDNSIKSSTRQATMGKEANEHPVIDAYVDHRLDKLICQHLKQLSWYMQMSMIWCRTHPILAVHGSS